MRTHSIGNTQSGGLKKRMHKLQAHTRTWSSNHKDQLEMGERRRKDKSQHELFAYCEQSSRQICQQKQSYKWVNKNKQRERDEKKCSKVANSGTDVNQPNGTLLKVAPFVANAQFVTMRTRKQFAVECTDYDTGQMCSKKRAKVRLYLVCSAHNVLAGQ